MEWDAGDFNAMKPRRFVRMFKPRFAPLVKDGRKLQTMRPVPKVMPRPGDIIDCRMWAGKPYRSKHVKLCEGRITRVSAGRLEESDVALAPLAQCGREGRPACCLTQSGLECIGEGSGGCGWHGCERGAIEKGCDYQYSPRGGGVTGYVLNEAAEETVWLCPACGGECAHTPLAECTDGAAPACGCASSFPDKEKFAREDGFESWEAMCGWFLAEHGLPFQGIVIYWDLRKGGPGD